MITDSRVVNNRILWGKLKSTYMESKEHNGWNSTNEVEPPTEGAYFIRCKEFLGEIDLVWYYKTKKGGYWSSSYKPTHWAQPKQHGHTERTAEKIR